MILLAHILSGIGQALHMLLWYFIIVVMIRAIISWVNPDPMNPFVRFLAASTDPIITPLRRYMPNLGPIDIAPLVVFFILIFLDEALVGSLIDYALKLRYNAMGAP